LILLDAYGLVALIADEPAAGEVETLLRREAVGMTVVNLAEALDVAERVHRLDPVEVRETVEPLLAAAIRIAHDDPEHAWRAAGLRLRYYDRRSRALSMADCLLLGAADPSDGVATADPVVAEVARAEAIRLVPLPDTDGRIP